MRDLLDTSVVSSPISKKPNPRIIAPPAPYADSQIAAAANINGLVLVTVNVEHFTGYEDLKVEDWSN
jgi:predicted nucleic acid-binding protein